MAVSPQVADFSPGRRLRLAREEAGYKLGELARLVDIHPDSLSDYEHNRTDPPARVLDRIVEQLRERLPWLTMDWIMRGETRV